MFLCIISGQKKKRRFHNSHATVTVKRVKQLGKWITRSPPGKDAGGLLQQNHRPWDLPSPLRPAAIALKAIDRALVTWQENIGRAWLQGKVACCIEIIYAAVSIYLRLFLYIYSAYIIVECNDNIDDSYFFVTWEWECAECVSKTGDFIPEISGTNSNEVTT